MSPPESSGPAKVRVLAPLVPVAPRPSARAVLAAILGLASALCWLTAAGLFAWPQVEGLVSAPRSSPSSAPAETIPTPEEPVTTPAEPGVVESVSSMSGFALMLDSVPPGASATVNGASQGEAPVTVGLDCRPGAALKIRFKLRGYETMEHTSHCLRDGLLKVSARLRPLKPAPR